MHSIHPSEKRLLSLRWGRKGDLATCRSWHSTISLANELSRDDKLDVQWPQQLLRLCSRLIAKSSWLLECSLGTAMRSGQTLILIPCNVPVNTSTLVKALPSSQGWAGVQHLSILWVLWGLSAPGCLWQQWPKGSSACHCSPAANTTQMWAGPSEGRVRKGSTNDVQPHSPVDACALQISEWNVMP